MEMIIKALFALFCIGIILGCVISVAWFCYAMIVNFYKIYIKKIPAKKRCFHASATFKDEYWQCDDCGECFPD